MASAVVTVFGMASPFMNNGAGAKSISRASLATLNADNAAMIVATNKVVSNIVLIKRLRLTLLSIMNPKKAAAMPQPSNI